MACFSRVASHVYRRAISSGVHGVSTEWARTPFVHRVRSAYNWGCTNPFMPLSLKASTQQQLDFKMIWRQNDVKSSSSETMPVAWSPCEANDCVVPPRGTLAAEVKLAVMEGLEYLVIGAQNIMRTIVHEPLLSCLYFAIFIPVGFAMNSLGQVLSVGKFLYWWQPITCYGLYVIPTMMAVRYTASLWQQYLVGLFSMCILELGGYSLGTSVGFEGNFIDKILGERNYALFMAVFFAAYIPVGNLVIPALLNYFVAMPSTDAVPSEKVKNTLGEQGAEILSAPSA